MRLPQNQLWLLNELVKVNKNMVGILSAGSSIEMPWQYDLKVNPSQLPRRRGRCRGNPGYLDRKDKSFRPSGGDLSATV